MISAEVSGARCEVPVPPGEPVPAAVVPNDGDLTYAEIAFGPETLEALAGAAMNTGDPLTEAACWNAAWRMVTAGELSGADLAGLVTRRLPGSLAPPAALPVAGLEVLLDWAVTAADLYTPGAERGAARAALAAASLAGAGAAAPGRPAQRALAAGFAASAQAGDQLAQARAWLDGGPRPDGLELDGDLRGRLLRTLAARGLATDEDLDVLAAGDPVAGERNAAACRAARPDAAAKEAAWELALGGGDRRLTEAVASALWVPGQEGLLAGYRDRYFAEALPVLDRLEIRQMRRLARALYPVTLAEPATLAATGRGAKRHDLSHGLRVVLEEQEVILRSALAARSTPRRWP